MREGGEESLVKDNRLPNENLPAACLLSIWERISTLRQRSACVFITLAIFGMIELFAFPRSRQSVVCLILSHVVSHFQTHSIEIYFGAFPP